MKECTKPGDIVPSGTPLQPRTIHASGTMLQSGDPVELVEMGEGARLAGSCMIWARASWAVLFRSPSLGTTGGRHFSHDHDGMREARALFAKWAGFRFAIRANSKGYLAAQGSECWFADDPKGWALFSTEEDARDVAEINHSMIGTAPDEGYTIELVPPLQ